MTEELTEEQKRAWKKIERMIEKYRNAELKTRQLVKKSAQLMEDHDLRDGFCDHESVAVELADLAKMHCDIFWNEYQRNVYWGE